MNQARKPLAGNSFMTFELHFHGTIRVSPYGMVPGPTAQPRTYRVTSLRASLYDDKGINFDQCLRSRAPLYKIIS